MRLLKPLGGGLLTPTDGHLPSDPLKAPLRASEREKGVLRQRKPSLRGPNVNMSTLPFTFRHQGPEGGGQWGELAVVAPSWGSPGPEKSAAS